MRVLNDLMQDRISIFIPGTETGFNETTLEVTTGVDTPLYTGKAMVGTATRSDNDREQGYPANLYTHTCRFPLEADVEAVPRGAIVTVLRMGRTELKALEGQQFFVEGEVLGSYSASRMLTMTKREAHSG